MLLVLVFIVLLILLVLSVMDIGSWLEGLEDFLVQCIVLLGLISLLYLGVSYLEAIRMDTLKIEIINTKVAINKMNSLVMVKDTKEFGVENFQQSTKTSELYQDYLEGVKKYNKILIIKRRMKKNIIFSWLVIMPKGEHEIILL